MVKDTLSGALSSKFLRKSWYLPSSVRWKENEETHFSQDDHNNRDDDRRHVADYVPSLAVDGAYDEDDNVESSSDVDAVFIGECQLHNHTNKHFITPITLDCIDTIISIGHIFSNSLLLFSLAIGMYFALWINRMFFRWICQIFSVSTLVYFSNF